MLTDSSYSRAWAQDAPAEWLTVKDLQRELRIGQQLAYRLLKDGTIPSVKIGGVYRIHRDTLEDLRGQARMGA